MAQFEWTSAIEIGHTEIDGQHRRLLQLCTAVIEPLVNSAEPKPGVAQLDALIGFVQRHFALEEGMMSAAAYPKAGHHVKDHASLLAELRTFSYKVKQAQTTDPVGVMSYLWSWLNLHIDFADRELVAWLKSHEAGGGG